MAKKSDDYVEDQAGWSLEHYEQPVVGSDELEEEADDASEEVEVAPVPDPVEEAPAEAGKGVVYRRLPNGALIAD